MVSKISDAAREVIIKRPNGDRVKITTSLYVCNMRREYSWSHAVEVCEAGKRKFKNEPDAATSEELHAAALKLFASIKPDLKQQI